MIAADDFEITIDLSALAAARAVDHASAVVCRLYTIRAPLFERPPVGKTPSMEFARTVLEVGAVFGQGLMS